ncbi:MAG: MFS transporter, partial [Oligoflexales bacterium]|nr:MFS transporter [Oligoflexales bacterium]
MRRLSIYSILALLLFFTAAFLDNIRGALMPVFCQMFGLSYGDVSNMFSFGYIASILAYIISSYGLLHLGSRRFISLVLIFAFCPLVFSPFISGLYTVIAFGMIVAIISGIFIFAANIFSVKGVDEKYRSRMLTTTHAMYGLGSFLAPFLLSNILGRFPWWNTLFFAVFMLIASLLMAQKLDNAAGETRKTSVTERSSPVFVIVTISAMIIYNMGEVLTFQWLSPYLVSAKQVTPSAAASIVSYFFLVMTGSRIVFSLLFRRGWENFT